MSHAEHHMRRALRIALRGRGKVSPNPMVGAVLVKRGRIVGERGVSGCGRAANKGRISRLTTCKRG